MCIRDSHWKQQRNWQKIFGYRFLWIVQRKGIPVRRKKNRKERCTRPVSYTHLDVYKRQLVFVCRKLYAQEMKSECFIDTTCDAVCYPDKDYHIMYIAEIVKVLKKED